MIKHPTKIKLLPQHLVQTEVNNQNITCAVSDFITSFAALDLADSSAASAIAS